MELCQTDSFIFIISMMMIVRMLYVCEEMNGRCLCCCCFRHCREYSYLFLTGEMHLVPTQTRGCVL